MGLTKIIESALREADKPMVSITDGVLSYTSPTWNAIRDKVVTENNYSVAVYIKNAKFLGHLPKVPTDEEVEKIIFQWFKQTNEYAGYMQKANDIYQSSIERLVTTPLTNITKVAFQNGTETFHEALSNGTEAYTTAVETASIAFSSLAEIASKVAVPVAITVGAIALGTLLTRQIMATDDENFPSLIKLEEGDFDTIKEAPQVAEVLEAPKALKGQLLKAPEESSEALEALEASVLRTAEATEAIRNQAKSITAG